MLDPDELLRVAIVCDKCANSYDRCWGLLLVHGGTGYLLIKCPKFSRRPGSLVSVPDRLRGKVVGERACFPVDVEARDQNSSTLFKGPSETRELVKDASWVCHV
jgi:hypothetical protein